MEPGMPHHENAPGFSPLLMFKRKNVKYVSSEIVGDTVTAVGKAFINSESHGGGGGI